MTYLLIGGGRTSANAAQAIREGDPKGSILIVAGEDRKPYDRPPLSKTFLHGKPPNPDDVEAKPDDFFEKHNVSLIRGVRATGLDAAAKTVSLQNGSRIGYEKLLLATGSSPRKLDIPGSDGDNVFYLRSVDDAMRIRDRATTAKSAVLIGAGYIGSEVSASLTDLGLKCAVIGREGRLWEKFASPATSAFLQRYYESKGVTFHMGAETLAIESGGVRLKSGEFVPGEMVIVGVGVTQNLDLAQQAGLDIDPHQGVITDSTLKTSNADIWAAGDIAAYDDLNFGKRWHLEHYMNADWQGTQVGKNMAGANEPFTKIPYFYSDMFDLSFVLRGNADDGKAAALFGSTADAEYTEIYADDAGRTIMGLAFTKDYKLQDVIGDKIEAFILAKRPAAEISEADFYSASR